MVDVRLVEMVGSHGRKVYMTQDALELRLEKGISITDALNRAGVDPSYIDPDWSDNLPLNKVMAPFVHPYGERPCLSTWIIRDMPYAKEIIDCLEPGNSDWYTIYNTITGEEKHTIYATHNVASRAIHTHFLGSNCPRYVCEMFRCIPRPVKTISIWVPGWLIGMFPDEPDRWLAAVACLGTMLRPAKVRTPYDVESLNQRHVWKRKFQNGGNNKERECLSYRLWKEKVRFQIPANVHERVVEWGRQIRTTSIDNSYVTAIMVGLGLPGALDGYLNSPVEWHSIWNRYAQQADDDVIDADVQQLFISRRHIDLIEGLVCLGNVSRYHADWERQQYRRSRTMIMERMFETTHNLPRERVNIRWKKHMSDNGGEWKTAPVSRKPVNVEASLFYRLLPLVGWSAQRDKGWMELEIDMDRCDEEGYWLDFVNEFVAEDTKTWYASIMDIFMHRYRTMQVHAFIQSTFNMDKRTKEFIVGTGYNRWVSRYGREGIYTIDDVLGREVLYEHS
jgi:hypothetical protein